MKPFLLLGTRPEDDASLAEYASFLTHTGLQPRDLVHRRIEREPLPQLDLDDWSGVLLGGSPFNSGEPHKSDLQLRVEADIHRLLDAVVAADFPFFGACYGIGTLGVYAGGVVDTTYGEPVQAAAIQVTAAGRADPLLAQTPDSFQAYVAHKEALVDVPPAAVLLATSPNCPVQMFRMGQNMYATQFHPELDEVAFAARITVYSNHGYFPAGTRDEVIASIRGAQVGPANRLLAAFVRRYARD